MLKSDARFFCYVSELNIPHWRLLHGRIGQQRDDKQRCNNLQGALVRTCLLAENKWRLGVTCFHRQWFGYLFVATLLLELKLIRKIKLLLSLCFPVRGDVRLAQFKMKVRVFGV